MGRYFLDTNVFFDVFGEERPSHQDSTALFKQAGLGRVELVLASISVMNALYSFRKAGQNMNTVLARMNKLVPMVAIAPVTKAHLLAGINSGWNDLEDAIQFHAALELGNIDAIVSNDKDFKQQKRIPVLTPAQALKRLKG
jgi:predicted nucleic acid-binding protein